MSKGERHGNKEAKKPKKEQPKTIAAPASIKNVSAVRADEKKKK